MSNLKHYPLGQMVPDSVHAVCSSLPTLADVVAYEEKHPRAVQAVRFGYPRFVFHEYVLRVTTAVAQARGWTGRAVYAVCSEPAARRMVAYVGGEGAEVVAEADFIITHFPDSSQVRERAKAFLQHTGVSISSRHAEDYLQARGLIHEVQKEELYCGDAEGDARQILGPLVAGSQWMWPANCGMNAFYAAIQAVRTRQAGRGRHVYLQLGWLYLDTQRVLEKLLGEGDRLIVLDDVTDRAALEAVFARHGQELAAVVTEVPTNPLLQSASVSHLSRLCLGHGVARILDPSMAGLVNVDVMPYCDILVTSLTKYAAWSGDVMSGLVVLNPDSPMAEDLAVSLGTLVEKPYERDWRRLTLQLRDMATVAKQVNLRAAEVVARLEEHPAVARVHHPLSGVSAENFLEIARSEQSTGGMITIELSGDLSAFYDRSRVVKGPSFGTHFTMMCPFLYLAHYDLVTTEEGRALLRARGLNPELIRLSVGTEPVSEIMDALFPD